MFKNNAIKKLSIAIASLALVLPLASVGNYSASANAKQSKKITKVINKKVAHKARFAKLNKKVNSKRTKRIYTPNPLEVDNNDNVKGHHYYKFAYNKKEYLKEQKFARNYAKRFNNTEKHYNVTKKSETYKKGFYDAWYNEITKNLVKSNKQYANGYILGNATCDAWNHKPSKSDLKQAKNAFKFFQKFGPGTGSAKEQWENEAHLDTF